MIESTHNPNIVYDVDYFIAKFSAIPEEKWCVGTLKDDSNRCCALGHCGVTDVSDKDYIHTEESNALYVLFDKALNKDVVTVNDTTVISNYPQPTPKQRILAALNGIKLKQSSNDNKH